MIKHLVISGGGLYGLSALGSLIYLNERGFWRMGDIESIYGTSVGAIIGVFVCLGYSLRTLEDYVVHKNWQDTFTFGFSHLVRAIDKQGIFDNSVLLDLFEPLFAAKQLALDISLRDFHRLTNVDLHIFAVDVYSFALVDLNHATHPQCRLLDAVYASSAIPVVFRPFYYSPSSPGDEVEEEPASAPMMCLVDGALLCNYPLDICRQQEQAARGAEGEGEGEGEGEEDEEATILAIAKQEGQFAAFTETSTFFEFFFFLLFRLFFYKPAAAAAANHAANHARRRHHEIFIPDPLDSLSYISRFATSLDERKALMKVGSDCAASYCEELAATCSK